MAAWLIRTDLPDERLARLDATLDDHERERARGMVGPAGRARFVAVHGSVREIVGRRVGAAPEQLRWRYGPHGKPELDGAGMPQISFSESDGTAMLAVCDARPVGIDVQRILPPYTALRIAERYFDADEVRFLAAAPDSLVAGHFTSLWSRKEACVKAHGGRLAQSLKLPVRTADGVVRDPDGALPGVCRLRDVPAPPGYRAALAVLGDAEFAVQCGEWPPPAPPTVADAPRRDDGLASRPPR